MLERFATRIALFWLSSLAATVQAQAQPEHWTLVHSEPGTNHYIDRQSVSTQGAYLTYWVLVNFDYGSHYAQAKPYRSARLLHYAHCATRAQDTKSFFQYYAPMGIGERGYEVTFEDHALRMEPVQPGSLAARLLDIACANKGR